MARIRTIKPEYWTNEQVMNCSRDARLLFIGLWNFADDGGNHPESIKTLKAEVFPGDDDLSSSNIRRMLDELSSEGLVSTYEVDGKRYWHVTGWSHQKIDRPNPKHPAYDPKFLVDQSPTNSVVEHSSNIRREIDDHSPPEGKGREGKGVIRSLRSLIIRNNSF